MSRLEPNLVGDANSNMQSIIACISRTALKFIEISLLATLKPLANAPTKIHTEHCFRWNMMVWCARNHRCRWAADFEHIHSGMNIESISNDVHKLCVQDQALYVMFVDLMANFDVCKRKQINEFLRYFGVFLHVLFKSDALWHRSIFDAAHSTEIMPKLHSIISISPTVKSIEKKNGISLFSHTRTHTTCQLCVYRPKYVSHTTIEWFGLIETGGKCERKRNKIGK